MRSFLKRFDSRKRLVTLALVGLAVIVSVSAGRTPEADEWIRIPNLSALLAVVLGIAALVGLVLVLIAQPSNQRRETGEVRSLRALLVLAAVLVVAVVWFSPEQTSDVVPEDEPVTVLTPSGGDQDVTGVDDTEVTGTEIAVLLLILLGITAAIVLGRNRAPLDDPAQDDEPVFPEELGPAVERAHLHLSEETDPQTAVLLAYASLENAVADLHRERRSTETPSEHMNRVLVDFPVLAKPAAHLGHLYALARFSDEPITESDRGHALTALGEARDSLRGVELEL